MDSYQQARSKPWARPLPNLTRPWPPCLILAGILLVCSGQQALSQHTARGSNTSAKLPSKLPSSKASNPSHNPNPSNDVQQLLAAAQSAQNAGRFDEAIATYNRVIALPSTNPQNAAVANLRIGNTYMVQRKFENAAIGYQRATALDPDYAEAYNNLG